MTPWVGELLLLNEATVLFPSWDYNGGKPINLSPGVICVYMSERYDYDIHESYWYVLTSGGHTGWVNSGRFDLL